MNNNFCNLNNNSCNINNDNFDFSFLNFIFDNIYVLYINDFELYNAKKKFNFFNINVEFYKGFDGNKNVTSYYNYLKEFKYKKFHLNQNITLLTKGQYGQLLSFYNIIKDAKLNSYNKILIFEPDIYFSTNFRNKLLNFKNEYYLLYLGCSQCNFYSEYTWKNINIYNDTLYNSYYYAHKTLGCFSMAIDKHIFNDIMKKLEQKNKPSDVLLTDIQNKYKNMSYIIYPNIVMCNVVDSKTSNYKKYNNQLDKIKNYKWFSDYIIKDYIKLDNKNYNVKFYINNFYDKYNKNNKIKNKNDNNVKKNYIKVYGFNEYKINFYENDNTFIVNLFYDNNNMEKYIEINNVFINNFVIYNCR